MNKSLIRTIMSVFFILIFLVPVLGQTQTNHLKRKISISLSEMELRLALPLIGEAGDFQFSYNATILDGDSLVQLEVVEQSVEEVLDNLLGLGIRYKVLGNHVVLLSDRSKKLNKSDRKIEYTISGYIYDANTGEIISQASIYEIDKMFVSVTNKEGFYSLKIPADQENRVLSYSKRGYNDTLIVVRPSEQLSLNISLIPKSIHTIEPIDNTIPTPSIHQRPIVAALVPGRAITSSENIQVIEERAFQVSLLPFVGSNRMVAGLITNKISLNVFAGYAEGVNGLEVGGFLNIDRNNVEGVQIGGFGNIVGGHTHGTQLAGFFNINGGSFDGLQTAGFSNLVMDTIKGVQLAGFTNALRGPMYGTQISGFANFTSQNVDGAQISGFTNIAVKDVKVAQITGFVNYSQSVGGVQAAGFSNIASGTNDGVQVSGFLNYAKEVNGLQVSVFNISDTVSAGLPIGFLSFVSKGYHVLEFSANELFWANISFKTGVKRLYNILTIGANNEWLNGGYGFGTQFRLAKSLSMSLDLTSSYILNMQVPDEYYGFLFKFSPTLDIRIFKHLTITAGPSLNTFADLGEPSMEFNTLPIKYSYPLKNRRLGDTDLRVWVGASIGIRL